MNWQTFITLIQNPSNTIFFISSTLDEHKIGSTMCALLNTNGGTLVIGYDKINIHLTGYNQTDQWIDQFIDTHFKNSNITSTFLFRSNKKILLLDITQSHHPYSFKSIHYKRLDEKIIEFTPDHTPAPMSTQFIPDRPQPHHVPPLPPKTQDQAPSQAFRASTINQPSIENSPTPPPEHSRYAPQQPAIPTQNTPIENPTTGQENNDPSSASSTSADAVNPNATEKPIVTATTVDAHIELQNDLNARQEKALHFIAKQGSIKNKQYRKLFNVSHKTAHLELAELVQKQKVIIVGSGRSTCYRLPNQGPPSEPLSTNDAVIPRHLLKAFLEQTPHITESLYADEFNMDLAQAINELQHYCDEGVLEKTLINNETCYIKAKQLSFI